MAEQEQVDIAQDDHEDDDHPNYKPPAKVSVDEIQQKDADDESLVRYKEALLGKNKAAKPFPDDPRNVIVQKLIFCPEGRDEIVLDLTAGDAEKKVFTLKEGINYKIKIVFYVQSEIVSGLKYQHKVSKKGFPVALEKKKYMVGSYGPKAEPYTYTSIQEELPSGMIARGLYKVTSDFTDDDKNTIHTWEWQMDIKKDWA